MDSVEHEFRFLIPISVVDAEPAASGLQVTFPTAGSPDSCCQEVFRLIRAGTGRHTNASHLAEGPQSNRTDPYGSRSLVV
jgi:hypothetical protein